MDVDRKAGWICVLVKYLYIVKLENQDTTKYEGDTTKPYLHILITQ